MSSVLFRQDERVCFKLSLSCLKSQGLRSQIYFFEKKKLTSFQGEKSSLLSFPLHNLYPTQPPLNPSSSLHHFFLPRCKEGGGGAFASTSHHTLTPTGLHPKGRFLTSTVSGHRLYHICFSTVLGWLLQIMTWKTTHRLWVFCLVSLKC